MLSNHSSAGVYVREIDLSERVAAVSTSIGAIVGESNKGPVNTPILITDTKKFLDTFGNPDPQKSWMHYAALTFLQESNRLFVVRVNDGAVTSGIRLRKNGHFNSLQSFLDGYEDPMKDFSFDGDDMAIITAKDAGQWGNDLSVILYPNTDDELNTFYLEVYYGTSTVPMEKYLVSFDYQVDGFGTQMYIEEHINKRSSLIQVKVNQNFSNPYLNTFLFEKFKGGKNGNKSTDGLIIQGWELFRDPEEIDINILINGGYSTPAVQRKMDDICQDRKDCVAVLDLPSSEQKIQDAIRYRRNDLNLNSSFSAIYSPDLFIADTINGKRLYIPPSGHIAAAYARTDRVAATWFAPAGLNRGKLNVLGIKFPYNQGDRDTLVESQINPIRIIAGVGINIWGQDTLQAKASAVGNMNVRRLMNFLTKSISIAALYSVFEPNDSLLRARLIDICNRFLEPIQNGRGIYRYEVICDESNNPPAVVAAGDLVLDVYIDPTLPAKRIHLNAIIPRTGGIRFAIEQRS